MFKQHDGKLLFFHQYLLYKFIISDLFSFVKQGCPVNKTVTFRENGEYLIKYRGNHLNDCNKIKRVVNI